MCDWVTLLYCRKLTDYCKPAIMEKIKIIKKKKRKKMAICKPRREALEGANPVLPLILDLPASRTMRK